MNQDRWQKVKGLFEAAVALSPPERQRFLDKLCGKDENLRQAVEDLLASDQESTSFLENPAAQEVASLIIETETKGFEAGKSFGHYEIIRQIGAGGMGEVYLAQDTKLDRRVAVKILNREFSRHEQNLQRFIQEAKAASALNHPNILVIHEIGETADSNYIVSEFIEGKTLRELFRESSLKLSEILDVSIQIANALSAAHAARIVHRDIKPENIIVRPDGYVKILDFGLAKLVEPKVIGFEDATARQNHTAKGVILGTVNYMSPEQAKGERVDERTDIFSFGVLVYEMIAGKTPFAGASMSETFANLINADPQPLARFSSNVPEELQRIIAKTLRKNKDERYQTMRDLLTDLKSLQKRLDFEADYNQLGVSPSGGERLNDPKMQKLEPAVTTEKDLPEGGTFNKKSIAVLPFANMSADAENEYFCDGLAEELLNALAKIGNLKVAARTSSFSFKNRSVDVSEIGNTLKVETILEGSVRRSGNRLRINVQLVNAADGYRIWSERYDGELKDIFELQDEITLAVIDELKVKFLSEEKAALRNRYNDNIEAYQLYLKGRYHYLKLRPAEIQTGILYFQQAIEIDRNYALAYVGLAQAYQTLPLAAELSANDFFPQAKEAALRAIEIDDQLAEAHGVLGWLLFWSDWDWNKSENECQRAIKINPNSADSHEAYAHLLSNTGRHPQALTEIKYARELDPLNLRINALEGQFLLHAGQIDEALARLQKTCELEPNFWLAHLFAASAYIEKEMYEEAIVEANQAKELSGGSSQAIAFGAYALAKSGNRAEVKTTLKELLKLSKKRYVPPYHIALVYQGLGERDKTLEWLNRAFEERDPKLAFLKVEPKWNNLRADSHFQELLRQVGLPIDETAKSAPDDKANITAAVSNLGEQTLEIATATTLESTAQFKTNESSITGNPKNQKRIFAGGIIILLLAVFGFGYYFWSASKIPLNTNAKKSLAVLPFLNTSQDANAEYLSDGITESIINNLSQLSSLRVMSRNSAFRFKNNQTETTKIAAQLGVEALVTGDIKQLGDKLVINVHLIDASDDSQIWGNQYVKSPANIIAAQNEIAQAVVNNLRLKLSNAEQQKLGKNYTDNVKAYEFYQRGRFYVSKGTLPDINKGIAYFQQAIDVDPSYALAYAGLAEAYRASVLSADQPPTEFLKAKAAGLKAVELDDSLSEAHRNLGAVMFFYDWDWKGAENQYQRALELDPNNANAHWAYAILLSNSLRHTEALSEIKLARELDPLNLMINMAEGVCLNAAEKPDEAIASMQKALELDPNFWPAHKIISDSYMQKGMFPEAIAEARKAKELNGDSVISDVNIAYALAKSGKPAEAREILNELLKMSTERYVPPSSIAAVYNDLGERDEALTLLERAFDARDVDCVFLKVAPGWNNLRNEPRFIELLRRINF